MSYSISFKVRVAGTDRYLTVGNCDANITWNVRKMITEATGLEWNNEKNNGLCVDVIPYIQRGYEELYSNPEKYKKYESPNGWETIEGTKGFFLNILDAWDRFRRDYTTRDFVDIVTFWIE